MARSLPGAYGRPLAATLADATVADLAQTVEHPGRGVSARGRSRLVRLDGRPGSGLDPVHSGGLLRIKGDASIRLGFTNERRPGAAECIHRLKGLSLRMMLLSDDRRRVVADLARQLGLNAFQAQVDPQGTDTVMAGLHLGLAPQAAQPS